MTSRECHSSLECNCILSSNDVFLMQLWLKVAIAYTNVDAEHGEMMIVATSKRNSIAPVCSKNLPRTVPLIPVEKNM
jgi:hypothetical protein